MQSLTQVDRAETFLRKLGVGQVRVRHHGDIASIEVEPRDLSLLRAREAEIAEHLNSLGFPKVLIDPAGYRSGQPTAQGLQL